MKLNRFLPTQILISIIAIQLLITGYTFCFLKEGNHSDEIWSYGLANSYYKPFIYLESGVGIEEGQDEDIDNIHEWISGDVFKKYITVQENERFSFSSVYSNQTFDHHPPLYYMLLHAVCSLFPNQFSFMFGFALNCIFLVVTQIYIFRLCNLITKSQVVSLMACLFYAISLGALQTFIFIRQYSLLTMLCVVYIYYSTLFYNDSISKKKTISIFITSLLIFLTHYYGIIFVGIFTACMCLYFVIKKRFKDMLIYGLSNLITLLIYFLIYPAAFKQLTESKTKGDNVAFGFSVQFRILSDYITRYIYGIRISKYASGNYSIAIAVIVLSIALVIPLCFLFRKEGWFIKFKSSSIDKIKCFGKWLINANYITLFSVISVISVMIATNFTTNVTKMGEYSIRYEYIVFPVLALATVIILYRILSIIFKSKTIINVCIFFVIISFLFSQYRTIDNKAFFLFKQYPNKNICEIFDNKNILYIGSEESEWTLTCFSNYCVNSDNFFFTTNKTLKRDLETIKQSGINVDYVMCGYVELQNEEKTQIDEWNEEDKVEKKTDSDKNNFEEEMENLEYSYISRSEVRDLISSLNNNNGIQMIGNVFIPNGYVLLFSLD